MSEADFSAWIGREQHSAPDTITARLSEAFAATLSPYLAKVGTTAPGLHWCLAPPVAPMAELGPDGHPAKGSFLPPVSLPRRMWAGCALEFFTPLQVGDMVTRTSRIVDIAHKTGRSGALCFVTVEHAYHSGGALALRERQDIVYRPAATAPPPLAPPDPEPAAALVLDWQIAVDPVMLFRYSALTFNGHRIHYDLAYAREVELYPDLVIHGPLQATLLLNLAAAAGGAVPRLFRFRGLSPACGTQVLRALAWREGNGLALAIRSTTGVTTMMGKATW